MSGTSAEEMNFKSCTDSGCTDALDSGCTDALEIVSQQRCLRRLWYHCGEATGHRTWSDGVKED